MRALIYFLSFCQGTFEPRSFKNSSDPGLKLTAHQGWPSMPIGQKPQKSNISKFSPLAQQKNPTPRRLLTSLGLADFLIFAAGGALGILLTKLTMKALSAKRVNSHVNYPEGSP